MEQPLDTRGGLRIRLGIGLPRSDWLALVDASNGVRVVRSEIADELVTRVTHSANRVGFFVAVDADRRVLREDVVTQTIGLPPQHIQKTSSIKAALAIG